MNLEEIKIQMTPLCIAEFSANPHRLVFKFAS